MKFTLSALPRILLSLAVGCVGGYVFWLIGVPLAWLLGAMAATSLVSVAGYETNIPTPFRQAMLIIIGILVGGSFGPDIWQAFGAWSISLLGLLVSTVLSVIAALMFLRLIATYDATTTYFASMPGGLSEMVTLGGQHGGSEADIVLIHSARVMLVVFSIPLAFQIFFAGSFFVSQPVDAAVQPLAILPMDIFWFVVCGMCGVLAAWIGMPAGHMLGAMVASAAAHSLGVTEVNPPGWLVAGAQIVIGASLGSRFAGHPLRALSRTLWIAAGLTIILIIVSVIMAWIVAALTSLPLTALILAYAPGGVNEMSLVALSLDMDPTLVATHHLARIFLIVMVAPFFLGVWNKIIGQPK